MKPGFVTVGAVSEWMLLQPVRYERISDTDPRERGFCLDRMPMAPSVPVPVAR